MTSCSRVPLLVLASGLVAPESLAQSTLYTLAGDSSADYFGTSVSAAGDVNGDGIPDMIVGAPWDDNNGPGSGSARVFSGTDGSILHTFDGDSSGDHLGFSVSGAGDVNGDGYDDLIAGAYGDADNGTEAGSAHVFSGKDGSTLYKLTRDSLFSCEEDRFGYSVSGAGDVNGDGFADLIVGAPHAELHVINLQGEKPVDTGLAFVYSGEDGSLLHRLIHSRKKTFELNSDNFGTAVSGAGDVNGDGYDDVVVGAPNYSSNTHPMRGAVRVFSGIDGKVLHFFKGQSGYILGYSVSGAGDVNGDGFADVIAGGLTLNTFDGGRGIARVYSGLDGTVLHTFWGDSPGDYLGYSVSGAGDMNGDGFDDLAVGAFRDKPNDRGSVQIFSGKDGGVLQFHLGTAADDMFGNSVAGVGDVNNDGFADVMVGSWQEDSNGPDSGSARVFSGCDALGTHYCSPAVANSTGLPGVMRAGGSDEADGGYFMLRASDLPPDQFGYFLTSQSQGFVSTPPGSQGDLCLGGTIGRLREQIQDSGVAGSFTIQVDLTSLPFSPPHTVLPGETWHFQAWYRDVNPMPTSNFTDGVSVTFL